MSYIREYIYRYFLALIMLSIFDNSHKTLTHYAIHCNTYGHIRRLNRYGLDVFFCSIQVAMALANRHLLLAQCRRQALSPGSVMPVKPELSIL